MVKNRSITIAELMKWTDLRLKTWTGEAGMGREISNAELNRPGLALTGYTDRFANNRIQIVGETEFLYMMSLASDDRTKAVEKVLNLEVPCVILTKGLEPPSELMNAAQTHQTALLGTSLTTDEFIHYLIEHLEPYFAPSITVHGSLMDVYGIGLLFTGRSGIGKSETALDLIERGHRLVADDVVTVYRMRRGVLIGTGNELLQHFMEIRGIGIIDIPSMFGIRSIRIKKRVEVVVRLEEWDEKVDYERLGIEEKTTTILGVELPYVMVPIVPGKNLTVIAEVVALNHMLKLVGMNPANELNRRLVDVMKSRTAVSKYDREDFE
ncbi:MAG: HPr kinase/phosphorylase [candidate division Zixibacteria bacterium]|nr:HPr kinase/phosphorylase [candidate division Zixibacteria bacterium]